MGSSKFKWGDLSVSERSSLIRLFVRSGVRSRSEMIRLYESLGDDIGHVHGVGGHVYGDAGELNRRTPQTRDISADRDTIHVRAAAGTPNHDYSAFLNSLPDNQRLTPESEYSTRKYWELNGKPKDFEEAKKLGMYKYDPSDSLYHANSVAWGDDGVGYFMKPKHHDTIKYELDWYERGLQTEPGGAQHPLDSAGRAERDAFRKTYDLDTTGTFFRYVPINKKAYGGNIYECGGHVYGYGSTDNSSSGGIGRSLLGTIAHLGDARIGAVGAQNVRDLYAEGRNEEADAFARQFLLANGLGAALGVVGGAAPGIPHALGVLANPVSANTAAGAATATALDASGLIGGLYGLSENVNKALTGNYSLSDVPITLLDATSLIPGASVLTSSKNAAKVASLVDDLARSSDTLVKNASTGAHELAKKYRTFRLSQNLNKIFNSGPIDNELRMHNAMKLVDYPAGYQFHVNQHTKKPYPYDLDGVPMSVNDSIGEGRIINGKYLPRVRIGQTETPYLWFKNDYPYLIPSYHDFIVGKPELLNTKNGIIIPSYSETRPVPWSLSEGFSPYNQDIKFYKHIPLGERIGTHGVQIYDLPKTRPIDGATYKIGETADSAIDKVSEAYKIAHLPGYQLKMLMSGNPLEKQLSKTGTISVNSIQAAANKGSKVEKAVIDKVLSSDKFAGQKAIDYNDFRKAVQDELIVYDRTPNHLYEDYGIGRLGFDVEPDPAGGSIPGVVHDAVPETYTFSSSRIPIGSNKHYYTNTLGHSRTYTTADEPDVLHVMESQSDWAQEGRVAENAAYVKERMAKHPGTESDPDSWLSYAKRSIKTREEEVESLKKMLETGVSDNGEKLEPHAIKQIKDELLPASERRLAEAKSRFYGPAPQEFYLANNYTVRQIQENLRYAAEKGQKKMRYPTRETAAKIEGYQPAKDTGKDTKVFDWLKENNRKSSPYSSDIYEKTKKLETAIENDLTAPGDIEKANAEIKKLESLEARWLKGEMTYSVDLETILSKYEAFPKEYQKLYKNADVRTVTDARGNTWYEVDVPENYLDLEWKFAEGGELNQNTLQVPIARMFGANHNLFDNAKYLNNYLK